MKYTAKQIKEMSDKELETTLASLQGDLRQKRFLASHGELRQVHEIKEIKKTIARVNTQITTNKNKVLTDQPK